MLMDILVYNSTKLLGKQGKYNTIQGKLKTLSQYLPIVSFVEKSVAILPQ